MLRTHFSKSQFIIVSLKVTVFSLESEVKLIDAQEGMFNNANVLFKVKFVDGVSTVTRTTPTRHQNAGSKERTAKVQ
jgi:structural maintenance of chromosome 2